MNAKKVLWTVLVSVLCMSWTAKGWAKSPQCARSNMLIVLDRSNSMNKANKLAEANKAIERIVNSMGGAIRFGLLTFCLNNKGPLTITVPITQQSNAKVLLSLPTKTCFGTPTKNAIDTAFTYFQQVLKPQSSNPLRETNVLLITDGKPTGDSPLNSIEKLFQNLNIKTFVVGFGNQINATTLKKMADRGRTNQSYLASDSVALNKALSDIGKLITTEKCDGIDNDCDGQVDEPWLKAGQACSDGVGACQRKGIWACNAEQNGIVCNAKATKPSQEICDGVDNNCDGQVDETWPTKGQECSKGVDACRKTGTLVCNAQGSDLECNVTVQEPTQEVCDGKDNDCDGEIDERLYKACNTACGSGIQQCANAKWTVCDAPKPQKEVCDGKDNDCDGSVDEIDAVKSLCMEGRTCRQGHCVVRCRNNECPCGFACQQGQCMPMKQEAVCKKHKDEEKKVDEKKRDEQPDKIRDGGHDTKGQDVNPPTPPGLGCSINAINAHGTQTPWSWSWVWLGLFLGFGYLRRRSNR